MPGEDLYYFAFGGGARLEINGALTQASLDATIPVLFCFDSGGDQVTDPRCPVGTMIHITAQFSSEEPIVVLRHHDENGVNVIRGRLGGASGDQNGTDQGRSIYAEIVESHTVFHGG